MSDVIKNIGKIKKAKSDIVHVLEKKLFSDQYYNKDSLSSIKDIVSNLSSDMCNNQLSNYACIIAPSDKFDVRQLRDGSFIVVPTDNVSPEQNAIYYYKYDRDSLQYMSAVELYRDPKASNLSQFSESDKYIYVGCATQIMVFKKTSELPTFFKKTPLSSVELPYPCKALDPSSSVPDCAYPMEIYGKGVSTDEYALFTTKSSQCLKYSISSGSLELVSTVDNSLAFLYLNENYSLMFGSNNHIWAQYIDPATHELKLKTLLNYVSRYGNRANFNIIDGVVWIYGYGTDGIHVLKPDGDVLSLVSAKSSFNLIDKHLVYGNGAVYYVDDNFNTKIIMNYGSESLSTYRLTGINVVILSYTDGNVFYNLTNHTYFSKTTPARFERVVELETGNPNDPYYYVVKYAESPLSLYMCDSVNFTAKNVNLINGINQLFTPIWTSTNSTDYVYTAKGSIYTDNSTYAYVYQGSSKTEISVLLHERTCLSFSLSNCITSVGSFMPVGRTLIAYGCTPKSTNLGSTVDVYMDLISQSSSLKYTSSTSRITLPFYSKLYGEYLIEMDSIENPNSFSIVRLQGLVRDIISTYPLSYKYDSLLKVNESSFILSSSFSDYPLGIAKITFDDSFTNNIKYSSSECGSLSSVVGDNAINTNTMFRPIYTNSDYKYILRPSINIDTLRTGTKFITNSSSIPKPYSSSGGMIQNRYSSGILLLPDTLSLDQDSPFKKGSGFFIVRTH